MILQDNLLVKDFVHESSNVVCLKCLCKSTNRENNIVHFGQIYSFTQIPQEQPFNHIYIKKTRPKPKFTVIL